MNKRFFIEFCLANLLVIAAAIECVRSEPVVTRASAAIQATAQVAPTLGLTNVNSEVEEAWYVTDSHEPGSHLYWLYSPRPSGVTVQIKRLGAGSDNAVSLPIDSWHDTEIKVLQHYYYAALVQFTDAPSGERSTAQQIAVTVIYTEN